MKFHVNAPAYSKGTEVEVPGLGIVTVGSTLDLTDVQVNGLRNQGYDVPEAGDMYLFKEEKPSEVKEPKTENLPGIAEVAEKERAKTTKKSGDK